jgi:plasma-membrane proton-efflux P-type ATPase
MKPDTDPPKAPEPKPSAAPGKPADTKPPDIASASVPDTLASLKVNPDTGLAHADVDTRRKENGYNEVAEKKDHPVLKFLKKFWGISAWMLELIMVLSAVLGKYSDLIVVGALLVINAVLGFMQEQRAAGVVAALRKRLQVNARVRRDSNWQVIPARELVPGDVVRVRPGDIIPADVKLLMGALSVDQSALTGESKDADKKPGEVLSSGSIVRRGEGNGVVMLTGAKTYFGRTTQLVQEARPKLHIEAVVAKVVRWLFVIVGALVCVVIVLSLIRGSPLIEMLPLMLVLLMSAVPVALPVMFTVSMAVGSKELAKLGVLVTRLSAAEDAATMDVLCVDKTGTITMNQLAVTGVIPLEQASESDVLFAGALASQEANQDAIDHAFLTAAKDRHVFDNLPKVAPISFAPFDAKNRRTEAVVEQNGQRFRVMKGAVRTIAEACGFQPPAIEALEARVSAAAAKGYRTLAVARGSETGALTLVGLVSLYDPPRPDAKQLIATLHDFGVPVKMLTGDAFPVACEIGQGVGLPNIRHMADLKADNKTVDLFAGADGFAEVFPEDKYTVVKHLQATGHVTGMTGDGVNDAPALRQAEVGIAVSTATDVAKGAASVVLTEPGLTNIVALVEQGRTIYQRILTWIINKISRTILKAAFVAIAFIVTGKFVVSVFAMLLLVFVMDFATIALATDRVQPSKKPETWAIGSFIMVSVVFGVAMVAETLLFLWIGWSRFGLATNSNALGTFSYLTLLYFCVFSAVSVRERRWFWATLPSKSFMAALLAGALVGTVLTLVGLPRLMPLPWEQTLAIFVYAMVCLVVNDAVKVALIKWRVPNAVARQPDAKIETGAKAESKPGDIVASPPEASSGAKPETKLKPETEPKPEMKSTPDANDKTATDLRPQIAADRCTGL